MVTKLRACPITTTCDTYGQMALNSPSMWVGAMYLPPDVLIRSFLRSVIFRKPSASTSPMSPVLKKPSAVKQFDGLVGQVVVAPHDGHPAQLDLAVLGDAHLEVAHRPAHRAELEVVRQVDERAGGRLGEAVALQNRQSGGVEELRDLLVQRRRARRRGCGCCRRAAPGSC